MDKIHKKMYNPEADPLSVGELAFALGFVYSAYQKLVAEHEAYRKLMEHDHEPKAERIS